MHKQLFDFLDENFTFYPSWGNPDGRGNPDGFLGDFHRPDYPNTPVKHTEDILVDLRPQARICAL